MSIIDVGLYSGFMADLKDLETVYIHGFPDNELSVMKMAL